MRLNSYLIIFLLLTLIAAPIVDAIVCDDCKVSLPLRNLAQRITKGADQPACAVSSSDACASDSEGTANAKDLCPVCSNIAAMGNACFGVPILISETNHLPKLLAFADPSYSITKPPEN